MNYIMFAKDINEQSAQELISTLLVLVREQQLDITLLINSNGGNVVAGVHMYNVIMSLPINLTTINVGNVDSIANVVFLAGGTRYATPASTFMFHSVGMDRKDPVRLEEWNLRQWLDSVVADNRRIASIISDRTGLKMTKAVALFREQKTRDSQWALENGLVQGVNHPTIPAGVSVLQI